MSRFKLNKISRGQSAALLVLLLIVVCTAVVLTALEPAQPPFQTKRVISGSPPECVVVILSPPYGGNARKPDHVDILWNGESIWSGVLPSEGRDGTGHPFELLNIRTPGGDHVLEVKHKGTGRKVNLELRSGGRRHYMLFGYEGSLEQVIQDLGEEPPMYH